MSKFKVGDKVVRKSGEAFSNGKKVLTVKELVGSIVWLCETNTHLDQNALTHYGQTLAELNVKAGDVVEYIDTEGRYTITLVRGELNAVSHLGMSGQIVKDSVLRHWRIISRATQQPNWLPCPADYKPQGNHEVTYHMGVPTHYYVTEPVMVDSVRELVTSDGEYYTAKGKTQDGKPVGHWIIDMDAD